jgi:hypothetical protein
MIHLYTRMYKGKSDAIALPVERIENFSVTNLAFWQEFAQESMTKVMMKTFTRFGRNFEQSLALNLVQKR